MDDVTKIRACLFGGAMGDALGAEIESRTEEHSVIIATEPVRNTPALAIRGHLPTISVDRSEDRKGISYPHILQCDQRSSMRCALGLFLHKTS